MTSYDYVVIAAYFALLLSVGYLTSKFVSNTSDYFRGGGSMLWWLVGSSAFMVQFSAWTFTGAASSAYSEGWGVLTIYLGNALGFTLNYFYFAARSRQTRAITTVEAIRERFDGFSQQFYTWLSLPLGIVTGSIWLFGLCLFVSVSFGIQLEVAIILTGSVVILSTLLGGSWASSSNDFVQLLVMIPVTIIAAVFALAEVGGVGEFVDRMPEGHLDISAPFANGLLLMWMVSNLLRQMVNCNNLIESGRYLAVKNTEHARKAAGLAAILSYLGPLIWFTPPLAAAILFPDLASKYPQLKNPEEAAYIAVAIEYLPTGMMGLMICAMLGATVSCMDTGLNRNAGIFTRNFYLPILRPNAGEKELMFVSRITTTLLGVLIILSALNISKLREVGIFELVQWIGSMVAFPMTIPLALVILTKKAAPWAAWSTTLIGFITSITIATFFNASWLEGIVNRQIVGAEINYWIASISVFANLTTCGTWFLLTTLWWNRVPPKRRAEIEAFNDRMRRPIGREESEGIESDHRQSHMMSRVATTFGSFIMLLAFIPNPVTGRIAFLFCGGMVLGVGLLLRKASLRLKNQTAAEQSMEP
ncbi:MAG: Na+:solute symporter [Synoicihabitans sp.]